MIEIRTVSPTIRPSTNAQPARRILPIILLHLLVKERAEVLLPVAPPAPLEDHGLSPELLGLELRVDEERDQNLGVGPSLLQPHEGTMRVLQNANAARGLELLHTEAASKGIHGRDETRPGLLIGLTLQAVLLDVGLKATLLRQIVPGHVPDGDEVHPEVLGPLPLVDEH